MKDKYYPVIASYELIDEELERLAPKSFSTFCDYVVICWDCVVCVLAQILPHTHTHIFWLYFLPALFLTLQHALQHISTTRKWRGIKYLNSSIEWRNKHEQSTNWRRFTLYILLYRGWAEGYCNMNHNFHFQTRHTAITISFYIFLNYTLTYAKTSFAAIRVEAESLVACSCCHLWDDYQKSTLVDVIDAIATPSKTIPTACQNAFANRKEESECERICVAACDFGFSWWVSTLLRYWREKW